MSVIGGGLTKLLIQFAAEFCVLDGALGLHSQPLAVPQDNSCGLCEISYFTSGKAHTCKKKTAH